MAGDGGEGRAPAASRRAQSTEADEGGERSPAPGRGDRGAQPAGEPGKPGRWRCDRPDVPVGVERVLYLAATDPAFQRDLAADREGTLGRRGLFLRPGERAMLSVISEGQLQAAIKGIDPSPRNIARRTFLGVVALTSAAVGAGGSLDRGCVRSAGAQRFVRFYALAEGLPRRFDGVLEHRLELASVRGLVQRIVVFVDVRIDDPWDLRIYLTSPSGTRVLLCDGRNEHGRVPGGIRGWFGADGLPPAEPMTALADQPTAGAWTLRIDTRKAARLESWRLVGHTSDESRSGSMATYTQYASTTDYDSGCECDPNPTRLKTR